MLLFIQLFSILSFCTASVFVCPPGGVHYDPPQNLSLVTTFPPGNSDSSLPAEFSCSFQINVPPGLFANVDVNFLPDYRLNGTAEFVVTDQSNFSETFTTTARYENFFFLANGGKVTVSTGNSEVSFNLRVVWKALPAVFNPIPIQLNASSAEPSTIFIKNAEEAYLVTADTRVSVLTLPPSYGFQNSILRGIYVYDGPTWNSTLLGSAMRLWRSNNQWVSTGNQLTLRFLYSDSGYHSTWIVLQDYENTKHIVSYQCGFCPYDISVGFVDCQFTLDNLLGTSAVMTSGYSETITHLDGNGTVDVYNGGITQSKINLLSSYSAQNAGLSIPQEFAGPIRTYVLEGVHSKAVLNLTQSAQNNISPVGAKKFFMSRYYPQLHTGQYLSGWVSPPNHTWVTFSFRIQWADMAKNSTLRITVYGEEIGKYSYHKTFTASNPPPINQTINSQGNAMSVYLDSYEGESTGLFMEYEVLKLGSNNFYWLVFAFILFFV